MNQLSDYVDKAIRNPLREIKRLIQEINNNLTQNKTESFDCCEAIEYAFKRLIKASVSSNIEIKINSVYGVRLLLQQFRQLINLKKLFDFIVETTDKKHAIKKNEKAFFILGRLLLIKAAIPIYEENEILYNVLVQDFEIQDLHQQILETLYLIIKAKKNKKLLAKFEKLKVKSQNQILHRCLIAHLKEEQIQWKLQQIYSVFDRVISEYPKENIVLSYFVTSIKLTNQQWISLWDHLIKTYSQDEKYSYKGNFLILNVLKYKVAIPVKKEELSSILHIDLMELWFSQLTVLNKKCKKAAQKIHVNIGTNEQLLETFFKFIHQKGIMIGNIQHNHPLQNLYEVINPNKYLKYLIEKIQEQFNQDWLCQGYSFIKLTPSQVSEKHILKIIELLYIEHKKADSQKFVQMIWSLVNKKIKSVKKLEIGQNIMRIFTRLYDNRKLFLSEQQLEQSSQLNPVYIHLLKLIKQEKQNTEEIDQLKIAFLNFFAASLIFSFANLEEVQTVTELIQLSKDLYRFIDISSGKQVITKKKKKDTPETQIKKPIHVLVDIFIAFLTRAPNFLRETINHLFKLLIPHIDDTDLLNLIAVLTRPDEEYIEETDA